LGGLSFGSNDLQQKYSADWKSVICSQDHIILATPMSDSPKKKKRCFLQYLIVDEKQEVIALMKIAKNLGIKTISLTKEIR